jgi:hypothetical protein
MPPHRPHVTAPHLSLKARNCALQPQYSHADDSVCDEVPDAELPMLDSRANR